MVVKWCVALRPSGILLAPLAVGLGRGGVPEVVVVLRVVWQLLVARQSPLVPLLIYVSS